MGIPGKRTFGWLFALAAVSGAAASACAQSLSLTYSLSGRTEPVQQAPAATHHCGGLKWETVLEACGRDLLAHLTPASRPLQPAAHHSSESSTSSSGAGGSPATPTFRGASPAPDTLAPALDLPVLGGPTAPSAARARGTKDAPVGSAWEPDLAFRVGSTSRSRGGEDAGWDAHRFTDIKYESHRQNHGYKTVGIELLVPFQ